MKQKGFTLIELVIVVAIVGILASAAMPLARWSVKRNKEQVLQQNLRIIRNAIDKYHDAAQAGLIEVPEGASGYPPDLKTLVEGVQMIGQMPPVMPGASDEYDASGPGLTGGLQSQIEGGQQSGMGGAMPGDDFEEQTSGGGRPSGGRLGNSGSLFGTQVGAQGQTGTATGFGQQQGGFGQQDAPAEPLIGADGQPVMLMFLRRIPIDPFTGKAEWGARCYGEPPTDTLWCGRDLFDVYSKALSRAINGTKYRDW
jgi:prepilin-type N-terminal cleavage/methylation domain-containing protein